MQTLVIADVQNDFMPGGALKVPFGDEIVGVINTIQDRFDLIVATQDWHPKDHVSFASNHRGKKPFDKIELYGEDQVLWPDHCVQGTPGAMFHPDLNTIGVSAIFRKGMNPEVDSYSGFYDNRHMVSTGLSGYLKEKGAHDIYFCGLAADICVLYTMLDALREGFSATLIEDASRPLDISSFGNLKREIMEKGLKIINSWDL
ncbi:MAG: bifunctional nicotinamidase/pyrazinamidase [Bacteroidales bacterium]|nr:bifunctional nicotinamidase/pyrazinamidase [Bacteroidales bacterium]